MALRGKIRGEMPREGERERETETEEKRSTAKSSSTNSVGGGVLLRRQK